MSTAAANATAACIEHSLEELESEIGELSAHIDAATCRLLLALAEFDRREGWARGGFRSCAHWMGWRVGLDLATARERVRVGRALEELPSIRAAFERGEVSYSKVRAMSRVATPENEQELLEVARHGTAHHLERLTRLFRGCTSAEERDRARRQHEERYVRTWTDADGMLCIQGRLPPEAGATVKRALDAALRALGQTEEEARPEEAESRVKVEVATGNVPAETSADLEIQEQSHREEEPDRVTANEAEAEAIAEREIAESIRGTFVPFGPAPRVRPIVEAAPEERAQRAADALGLVAEWALAALERAQVGEVTDAGREGRFEAVLHVDAEALANDAPVGRCDIDGGPRLSAETMRRLCCASPVVTLLHGKEGELLGPGRRTRRISAPLWRALRTRDEICAWPGCTARRGLVVHHVEHWARGGETKLPNLVRVCRSHHWALHEGGFRVEGRAPDGLTFFTPDGRQLPASPVQKPVDGAALASMNREIGIAISPGTGLTRWWGERMDYDWAVESLLRRFRLL
jgi:hypothetical protein